MKLGIMAPYLRALKHESHERFLVLELGPDPHDSVELLAACDDYRSAADRAGEEHIVLVLPVQHRQLPGGDDDGFLGTRRKLATAVKNQREAEAQVAADNERIAELEARVAELENAEARGLMGVAVANERIAELEARVAELEAQVRDLEAEEASTPAPAPKGETP